MSIKSFLMEKSQGIGDIPPEPNAASDSPRKPSTAVGQSIVFREQLLQDQAEIDRLNQELSQFEGSVPTKRIDAKSVKSSAFANRLESHFQSQEFAKFREEISSAGGNVQPIKVRPILGHADFQYEVVFGHRRHRACLDLGIPVLAVIESVSDQELFEAMVRENLARLDLSPYEAGRSYRIALERGLYPSQSALGRAIGVSQAHISQALLVADLPSEIHEVFPSPSQIQYRWAVAIADRLRSHRKQVMGIAKRLSGEGAHLSAREVFRLLTDLPSPKSVDLLRDGKVLASIREMNGVVTVAFRKGKLSADRVNELRDLLENFLKERR